MSNQLSNSAATDEHVKPSAKRGGKKKTIVVEFRYKKDNGVALVLMPYIKNWTKYKRYSSVDKANMAIATLTKSSIGSYEYRIKGLDK